MGSEQKQTAEVDNASMQEEQNIRTSNKDEQQAQSVRTSNKDEQQAQSVRTSNKDEQQAQSVRTSNRDEPEAKNIRTSNKDEQKEQNIRTSNKDEQEEQNIRTSNKEQPHAEFSGQEIEKTSIGGKKTDAFLNELSVDMIESTRLQKKRERHMRNERNAQFRQGADKEDVESKKLQILRRNTDCKNDEDELMEYTKELLLDGTYDNVLIQELKEVSTTSSDSESVASQTLLSLRNMFLDDLEYMPSLSDLSTEEEVEVPAIESEIHEEPSEAKGYFVDPLTGSAISTLSSNEEQNEVAIQDAGPIQNGGEEEDEVDDTDWEIFEEPEDIFQPVVSEQEDVLELLITVAQDIKDDERTTVVNPEMLRAARELQEIVTEFLTDVINKAVDISNYIDPNVKLAQSLDKLKLLKDLKNLIGEYTRHKCDNSFLNKKAVDYCKISKAKRLYDALPPDIDAVEYARYKTALHKLDYFMEAMKQTKYKNALLMSSVLMDLQYTQSIALSTEEHLEQVIRGALSHKDSEYLKRVVDREMRQMKYLRNELSDTRLFLITRKHTLARLNFKINKVEQITPELSMTTFISIQNDVHAIEKKVEDRSGDLNRSCQFYYQLIHKRSQALENIRISTYALRRAKDALMKKQKINWKLRDRLYKLKMEHSRMRQEKHDLTLHGGLVTNVLLMHDYDKVLEIVAIKRQVIARLRDTMVKLENKINSALKADDQRVLDTRLNSFF